MNKQSNSSIAFEETRTAIEKIKKNVSKLTESEKATIELLLDKEAQNNLAASLKDAREGNLISWDSIKKDI
ncbi:MAG: hypothetical protein AAB847_02400 [Patescibacteria group bacterium]